MNAHKLIREVPLEEELTLKEISAALEVSESRVSQLHTKALQKMRGSLGEYMGILINK